MQGSQLARDIDEIAHRLYINAVLEQVNRRTYRKWLERKYHPPYGGTLVLFGPITNLNRLLPAAEEVLQLGTARMNLLNTVQNPTLRRLIEYCYKVNARIGNGSTADAIRFERETGILLSKTGHIQKGKEVVASLEGLLRSNRLNQKDAEIAREIIADLKDALK